MTDPNYLRILVDGTIEEEHRNRFTRGLLQQKRESDFTKLLKLKSRQALYTELKRIPSNELDDDLHTVLHSEINLNLNHD